MESFVAVCFELSSVFQCSLNNVSIHFDYFSNLKFNTSTFVVIPEK